MNLKVLYFGMIAEVTNCTEEFIPLQTGSNVDMLKDTLKNKYQHLEHLSFNIAVNKEISPGNTLLIEQHEIALLPPFSGG